MIVKSGFKFKNVTICDSTPTAAVYWPRHVLLFALVERNLLKMSDKDHTADICND